MQVTVFLSDGGQLEVADMDPGSVLDMREDLWNGDTRFVTLDMDGTTVLVARAHIVRVDLEMPDESGVDEPATEVVEPQTPSAPAAPFDVPAEVLGKIGDVLRPGKPGKQGK